MEKTLQAMSTLQICKDAMAYALKCAVPHPQEAMVEGKRFLVYETPLGLYGQRYGHAVDCIPLCRTNNGYRIVRYEGKDT